MEFKLKDDINRDDIIALKRHMRALDEFLDVLDRNIGNGYKDVLNEKRVLREMSFVEAEMKILAEEIPPAEITVLEK